MFLTKTFATLPRLSGLVNWFHLPLMDKSHAGSAVDEKTSFVVHKTKNGRWCWEFIDENGRVHGRSTDEFVRREQAIASARLVQYLAADAMLTDHDGREIQDI